MHVLSNTKARFEAPFMKKLSNNEAEIKKALLIKSIYLNFLDICKLFVVKEPLVFLYLVIWYCFL